MLNFSTYYSIVILLLLLTRTCLSDDFIINDQGTSDSEDDSGSGDDDVSDSGLDIHIDICQLPIDAGDCGAWSQAVDISSLSDSAIKELYEINKIYDIKTIYEVNERHDNEVKHCEKFHTRVFGYNRNTEKCEEFNFNGRGGNDNRFATLTKCRKTCYTPLKYFLSEVTDLLLFKITNDTSGVYTT